MAWVVGSLITLVNHHVVDKAQAADHVAHVCLTGGEEGHLGVLALVQALELGRQDRKGELEDIVSSEAP